MTIEQQRALAIATARLRLQQQGSPEFANVQSGSSTSKPDYNRMASDWMKGPADLDYSQMDPEGLQKLTKGFLGLPRDLSQVQAPSLKDMLVNSPANPLFTLQQGAKTAAGMASNIYNAPSNLSQTQDPYAIGQGLSGVAAALPLTRLLKAGALEVAASKPALERYGIADRLREGIPDASPAGLASPYSVTRLRTALNLATGPVRRGMASIQEKIADALVRRDLARQPQVPELTINPAEQSYSRQPVELPPPEPPITFKGPDNYVPSPPSTPRPPQVVPSEPYNPELFKTRKIAEYLAKDLEPEPVSDLGQVERAIGPSGRGAKRSVLYNAPKLIEEVPEVKGLGGAEFDSALMKGFRRIEGEVNAAEAAVPRYVNIKKTPLVDQWKKIAADYRAAGRESSAAKVDGIIEKWDALPERIPWETFVKMKRGFFGDGGVNSMPLRRSYAPLMEVSSTISKDLAKANRSYSVARQALDDAQIDIRTGRRIMDVAKSREELARALAKRSQK